MKRSIIWRKALNKNFCENREISKEKKIIRFKVHHKKEKVKYIMGKRNKIKFNRTIPIL